MIAKTDEIEIHPCEAQRKPYAITTPQIKANKLNVNVEYL